MSKTHRTVLVQGQQLPSQARTVATVSADIAAKEQEIRRLKERIEELHGELLALHNEKEAVCPGHEDDDGFMYGSCKHCGAFLG
jgi:hypothetical protein